MNAIPPAALAVMRAAAEDYRLITDPEEATPPPESPPASPSTW